MTRLFWRFLLSIGLTMAGLVGASLLISFAAASRWEAALQEIRPTELREAGREVLAAGGTEALAAWIRAREKELPTLTLLAVGPDGKDLLGRPVPRPLARRAAGGMRDRLHGTRPESSVREPSTEPFLLVPLPRRPGPLGLLGAPGARWWILAASLGIAGLASLWLARSLSQPVRALGRASRAFADGRLDARAGIAVAARRDELGALGRDFDRMAERTQLLLQSQAELLRNISHDLRTPLARIRMAAGLAAQRGAADPELLSRIEGETDRLNALIEQILTLARLDAQPPSTETLDLDPLIHGLLEAVAPEASQQGIELLYEPRPGAWVAGHRVLLESILGNLLDNAMKYAPGAPVEIRLDDRRDPDSGSWWRISIRDHGPGVPEDALARIFKPFVREDAARGPDDGEGLGLAIAARGVGALGGRIKATNAPGGGLAVNLYLPAAASADQSTGSAN